MNNRHAAGSSQWTELPIVVVGGIVLMIIAWLTLYPRVFRGRMQGNYVRTQLTFVAAAATEFYRAHHHWPGSIEEIARTDPGGNIAFLKGSTNDFWGHPFAFEPYETNRGYGVVISYGADGRPGGRGKDRDQSFPFADDQGKNVALFKQLEQRR